MIFHENAKNWEPPDGLGYSSLRPVKLSAQGIILAVLGVVFLIGGPTLGMVIATQSRNADGRRSLLREQGVDATAEITRVWRTGGKDSRNMVSYRFDEGTGRSSVPTRIWRDLKTGDALSIRYVRMRPEINHPAEWEEHGPPIWVAWLPGGIMLFPAILFVIMIRRQMLLLSEGRPAPGVVTGLKRTDKSVTVLYEFTLLSGAVMKGKSGGGRKPPGVGSPCCVLYDPENPKRNAVYPLPLVKLER